MKTPPRRRQAAKPVPVPPQLAGLLALITQPNIDRSNKMQRALTAARAALRDAFSDDVGDRISAFIVAEAARGPWKALHQHLENVDEHPFTTGDYENIYGLPALTIGMALMYVYLTDGGAR